MKDKLEAYPEGSLESNIKVPDLVTNYYVDKNAQKLLTKWNGVIKENGGFAFGGTSRDKGKGYYSPEGDITSVTLKFARSNVVLYSAVFADNRQVEYEISGDPEDYIIHTIKVIKSGWAKDDARNDDGRVINYLGEDQSFSI